MKAQLQYRLVKFASQIVNIDKNLKPCLGSRHLYAQILRSATSAALNYGEAQTAESRKDFIHKLGVTLKELKETEVNLEVILESGIYKEEQPIEGALKECRELIAIFMVTRRTARENNNE
jgi:four helix bundle protein